MPKIVPDASPMAAVRVKTEATSARALTGPRATEISITPATDTQMATKAPGDTRSPRKIRPKMAAWAGSVRE